MSLLRQLQSRSAIDVSGPRSVPGLTLWLAADRITGKSDGDAVGTWSDLSGNANDATQATGANQPLYKTGIINSKPALLFDGSNDKLVTPSFLDATYNTAFTVFGVVKQTGATFHVWAANNNGKFYGSGSLDATTDHFNTTGLSDTSLSLRKLTPRVMSFRYGGATKKGRTSGTSSSYAVDESATGNLGLSGALTIGDFDAGGFPWDGHIAELLVYKRDLSTAEFNRVEGYLRNKYALNWSATPQIIADGNSLTAGVGASDAAHSYPSVLVANLGGGYDLSNFGVGGQTTTLMISDQATQIHPIFGRHRQRNILLFWEGTNDIQSGLTGAQAYTNTSTYISNALAAAALLSVNLEVFALTVMPRTDFNGTQESYRATYNTSLIAGAGTYRVVDVAADARLSNFANLTYFDPDGIHLNDAGYAVVASLVQAQL